MLGGERTVLAFEIFGGSFSCARNSEDPANIESLPRSEGRAAREDGGGIFSSTVRSPYNKRTMEAGLWGIWAFRPDAKSISYVLST